MKVSVIVPTYRTSDAGLRRLLGSLDAQTMPADEFEVIFVDDGSPDDTVERLTALTDGRDNVTIVRLQNSGWPSKPRNAGMDHAAGEYVLFMDHDDELYPDALRAAQALAERNGSDVVVGKEARSDRVDWALDIFTEDLDQAVGREDMHPLQPLNPHKLYRLAFLREHGIRFVEGRKVLWEDIFFNTLVARHARVISVLSSVPFYHWVTTEGSGTSQFVKWADDYWMWLRRILESTTTQLDGDPNRRQREQLLRHEYAGRILGTFDAKLAERPVEARVFLFEQCRALLQDFGLDRFDETMDASQRMRSFLLKNGDRELLERLGAEDTGLRGQGEATAVRWVDGRLQIAVDATWCHPDGSAVSARREDGRILKQFSPELTQALPPHLRDMTAEVDGATLTLCARSRTSRVAWLVPTAERIVVNEPTDGTLSLSGTASASLDPDTTAMGGPLTPGTWDLFVRACVGRNRSHRPLASSVPASVSVVDGTLRLAYPNDGGALTVILDGAAEAVRRLAPTGARLTASGELEITLAGTHDGAGEVPTTVMIDSHLNGIPTPVVVPAQVVVDDGAAVLRLGNPGTSVRVRVGDRAPHGAAMRTITIADSGAHLKATPPSHVISSGAASARRGTRSPIRLLLLTDKAPDDAGDRLMEASAISLLRGAMKNLGLTGTDYTLKARAARVLPGADPHASGALSTAVREAIGAADLVVTAGDNGLAEAVRAHTGDAIPTICLTSDPTLLANVVFRAQLKEAGPPRTEKKTVGLVVAAPNPVDGDDSLEGRHRQRRFWREVVEQLKASGYDYRLFTTGGVADEEFLAEMVKSGDVPAARTSLTINSPEELATRLKACHGVIAHPPHASAACFALGTPCIGLAGDVVVSDFYHGVGLAHRALTSDRWTADVVVPALSTAMAEGRIKDKRVPMEFYDSLFRSIRDLVLPGADAAPYDYAQLRKALPRYRGTTDERYRATLLRKTQRALDDYRRLVYA